MKAINESRFILSQMVLKCDKKLLNITLDGKIPGKLKMPHVTLIRTAKSPDSQFLLPYHKIMKFKLESNRTVS